MAFLVAGGLAAGAAGAASLTLALALRGEAAGGVYASLFAAAAVGRCVVFVCGRPDRHRRYHGYFDEIVDATKQATVGSLGLVVFAFFWRDGARFSNPPYSRAVFAFDWLFAVVLLSFVAIGAKAVLGRWRRAGHDSVKVVVMGVAGTSLALVSAIDDHPETGYQVVGVIDDRDPGDGDAVEELRSLASAIRIDEVVLSSPELTRKDVERLVRLPELARTKVTAAPHLFGLPPTKARLSRVGDFPLLALQNEPLAGARRAFKRGLDIVVASVVLVLTAPIMIATALAVRLTSRGPALFLQKRIGMDGVPFRVVKFRTMRVDADTNAHREFVMQQFRGEGTASKIPNDPRITKLGAFLRCTSIDELPQLFNVLMGHMSLVGPRPALDYEVELYQDWQHRRFEVRPGLTGLWQVSGRSKLSFQEMHRLDIKYIDTWTPFADVRILARTIPALLRRRDAAGNEVLTDASGPRRVSMLGVDIDALTMSETVDRVEDLIAAGGVHQHTCINAAKAVMIADNPEFGEVVRASDLISADGMAIVWAARALGHRLPERVAGVDLFDSLLARAAQKGWRVYFLGATREVVSEAVRVCEQKHAGLVIAGHRDGYFSVAEEPQVAAEIAATQADLVFVAMPTPRKECFLGAHLETIGAGFVMGVGGTFDVVAGKITRAPRWMQRIGMEWFHRLAKEPRRMFKRYLVGNTRFILLVASERRRRAQLRRTAVEVSTLDIRDETPLEAAVTSFAR